MPGRLFYYRDEDGQRDHLRAHPDDADRYAELKQRLAAEHTDGTEYTKAKTELIQELTDRARADRGLPPVSVWEE
jgi:GrpB-like predicted nucleotidyltransferase (UPF0157 family)